MIAVGLKRDLFLSLGVNTLSKFVKASILYLIISLISAFEESSKGPSNKKAGFSTSKLISYSTAVAYKYSSI